MATQMAGRTALEHADLTHLDRQTLLHLLCLSHFPPNDGQSSADQSNLQSILELIGKELGDCRPCWIASRRQLWLGSELVKQFARLAPHQSAILEAFQAAGWPTRIDNPLRQAPTAWLAVAKRRLRQTIDNLNRGMTPATIRFRGDGSGLGIRWELCKNTGSATNCGRDQPTG
jgi:hypothetical protein